jgi:hypothetical protein
VSLLPFFEFCEHSAAGEIIRGSSWLFPVIESVHLLGLVVIGGSVLVVDMRLFGLARLSHLEGIFCLRARKLLLLSTSALRKSA